MRGVSDLLPWLFAQETGLRVSSLLFEGTPTLEVSGQALWREEGPWGCWTRKAVSLRMTPQMLGSLLSPESLSGCSEWLTKLRTGQHDSVKSVMEPLQGWGPVPHCLRRSGGGHPARLPGAPGDLFPAVQFT